MCIFDPDEKDSDKIGSQNLSSSNVRLRTTQNQSVPHGNEVRVQYVCFRGQPPQTVLAVRGYFSLAMFVPDDDLHHPVNIAVESFTIVIDHADVVHVPVGEDWYELHGQRYKSYQFVSCYDADASIFFSPGRDIACFGRGDGSKGNKDMLFSGWTKSYAPATSIYSNSPRSAV